MPKLLQQVARSFTHLFFPHVCAGCGTDTLSNDAALCAKCHAALPETGFFEHANNPVEQKFYGQIKIQAAGSMFYFTKNSLLQQLISELKYRGNKTYGFYLGNLAGMQLMNAARFSSVDVLVPLPLHPKKEKMRGYNQAAVIAEGMSAVWDKPLLKNAVQRSTYTTTQTHKSRVERWEAMRNVFSVENKAVLENKHILLVDDIITTGATLEACAENIITIPGTRLSVATVAYTI